MRSTRLVPSGSNTFLIRVDESDTGIIQGVVDGAGIHEPIHFSSLANLILLLEGIMDELEGNPFEDDFMLRKVPENFAHDLELEVLFRQNYSWQGKIRLLESKKEATFRSVLELMILMQTIYSP